MAEETAERGENAYDWQSLMFLYNAAIKEVRTKLDIMNDEFQYIHQYNPIEYIKSRIKTPNSIAKKLSRHGLENTMENMVEHINDIAGVRIVCSFTSDIYRLAEMIGKQKEFTILYIKDYMKHPKHKIYYKFEGNAPEYISRELRDCAAITSKLDAKMLSLNEAIIAEKERQQSEEEQS